VVYWCGDNGEESPSKFEDPELGLDSFDQIGVKFAILK
jgi:hypothetical protein